MVVNPKVLGKLKRKINRQKNLPLAHFTKGGTFILKYDTRILLIADHS